MKIIAYRPKDTYLVQVSDTQSRVLDRAIGRFHRALDTRKILGRGYWEPYTGSQDFLAALLKGII